MVVEQRIITQGKEEIERSYINPGKKANTKAVVIEAEHPHLEHEMTFTVFCDRYDRFGRVSFYHPDAGIVAKGFSGDSQPFYMIRNPDGSLGRIEWEHKVGTGSED